MTETATKTQKCRGCLKEKAPEGFYIDKRNGNRKKTCIDCTTKRRHAAAKRKKGKVGFCRIVENPTLCLPY